MSPYSSNDTDTLLSGSQGCLLRDKQNSKHPTGFQAMSLQYRLSGVSAVDVDGNKTFRACPSISLICEPDMKTQVNRHQQNVGILVWPGKLDNVCLRWPGQI